MLFLNYFFINFNSIIVPTLCIPILSFQYSDFHITQPNEWDLDFGASLENNETIYPIRAYLSGFDNSLEITFMQKDSDLDYICVEDIQGYSVSRFLVIFFI